MSRFLGNRKWILGIIAACMVLFLLLGTTLALRGQEEYVPPNNVQAVDAERSQVYVTGTGYHIDQDQEQVHEKVEKQREQKQEQKKLDPNRNTAARRPAPAQTRPGNNGGSTPSPKKRPSGGSKKPKKEKPAKTEDPDDVTKPEKDEDADKTEEERSRLPVIKTSLVNGDEISGDRIDFWVTVKDYKGRNIPVFSVDDGEFTVTVNGTFITSDGESGGKTSFRAELKNGRNDFTITATDRDGRKKTLRRHLTAKTDEEAASVGTVTVAIKAPILGLGTIYSAAVDIKTGDSAKDVLEEAVKGTSIDLIWDDSYLKAVKKNNIARDASISDAVRSEMEDRRKTEKDPDKQDKDQLMEHDFYDSSGWIYLVNGSAPEVGMKSHKMEDGDELELYFALDFDMY